jgi:hypothetical protein
MAYDAAKHYTATPDGTGGVRLRFRDDLGARGSFLPGHRQRDGGEEELDQQQPEIIGRLPSPGDQFHYSLEPDPDGDGWIVCLVSGPDPDQENGETIGDRSRIHRLHFPDGDPSLKEQNRKNRIYWSRSRDTATADKENRVFRTGPIREGERLELRGPDKFGMYDLVLISGDVPDIAPRQNVGKAGASRSVTGGDKGYARGSSADSLHKQNEANKRFWVRGGK